jgi:hypothetical protein
MVIAKLKASLVIVERILKQTENQEALQKLGTKVQSTPICVQKLFVPRRLLLIRCFIDGTNVKN